MNNIITLNENNYDEIFSLSQFAFQYRLTEEELRTKKEDTKRHIIWGIKDGDTLAAKLHLIPLSVYVNGSKMEMGGIASVATWPEYRRKGMVKDLLAHALHSMREKGIPLSFLHPFSVPFYRKYGWEIAFSNKHYEIPMTQLKIDFQGAGYVRREKKDPIPILDTIYHKFAKTYNGTLIRDEKWWKHRVFKNSKPIIAIAYNNADQPEGYIIYEVKERTLKIKEMVYTSINALKVILQFIANHDSMADKIDMIVSENDPLSLFIPDPRFEQCIKPYFMARIVDVSTFFHHYFKSTDMDTFSLQLKIVDDFIKENSGIYTVTKSNEELHIEQSPLDSKEIGITCNIQQLTSMFLGYKRPIELYELEKIHGDIKEIGKLEKLITRKQTYFPDFF